MSRLKRSLNDWLAHIEALHPTEIELGLERIKQVWTNLGSPRPGKQVVTIAGTNGKGSCVAYLHAIAHAHGKRVASYTSPHLLRFTERLRVNDWESKPEIWCRAFEAVDDCRAGVSLTYFEFVTLAAIVIMHQQALDLAILEVGLGGRLDAVNIIDAQVAIITAIGLDHEQWLGHDKIRIAAEKAGIVRAGIPVIIGSDTPDALVDLVRGKEGKPFRLGHDIRLKKGANIISVQLPGAMTVEIDKLQQPGRWQQENAAMAIAAWTLLEYPVHADILSHSVRQVSVTGRLQCLQSNPATWVDVAHNPQAAASLANWLRSQQNKNVIAVFGVMADKAVGEIVEQMADVVQQWVLVAPQQRRAMSVEDLAQMAFFARRQHIHRAESVAAGIQIAQSRCSEQDLVIVFGSFYTVSEAMLALTDNRSASDVGTGIV